MLCEHVREHLSAYADRELSAELSAAIRAHLASCPACKALLADLRTTADLVGRLPARPAPERLAEDVLREIERRVLLPASEASVHEPQPQERSIALRRASPWPRAIALAASILLVVGIGFLATIGPGGGPAVVPTVRPAEEKARAPASTDFADATGPSAPALAARKDGPPLMAKRAAEAAPHAGDVAGAWEGERQEKLAAVPEVASGEAPLRALKGGAKDYVAASEARPDQAVAQVQMAMNRVAQREAPLEDLVTVANTDNLARVRNTLVIETDVPEQANRDLEQLFLSNGWQPVADQAQAAQQPVASVAAGGAAMQQKVGAAQAAPGAPGFYFLAHTDGEKTWVVVADWDDVSRFSSQLANVDRLTVGEASSPPFRAIRALQRQVRSQVAAGRPITGGEEEKRGTDAGETLGYLAKAGPAAAPSPQEPQAKFAPAPAAPESAQADPGAPGQTGVAMKRAPESGAATEDVQTAGQAEKPPTTEGREGAAGHRVRTLDEKADLDVARDRRGLGDRTVALDESAEQDEGYLALPGQEQVLLVIRVQQSAEAARAAELLERQAEPAAE